MASNPNVPRMVSRNHLKRSLADVNDTLDVLLASTSKIDAMVSHGAIGDGAADDTTAVQNALLAGIAQQLPVYFPAGTYKVNEISITMAGHLEVHMDPDAKIIGNTGYATPVLILDGGAQDKRLIWRGGQVDNSLRGFVAADQSGTGLSLKRLKEFILDGVKFQGGADWSDNQGDSGITCLESYKGTIQNCWFYGQPDIGIYFSGGNNLDTSDDDGDILVTGCKFERCSIGISVKRQMARVSIIGNHFIDCYSGVSTLEASTVVLPGRQCIIANNIFKRTQTRAIELRVYGGTLVTGNIIEDFGYDRALTQVNGYGIRLLGTQGAMVTGNVFRFNEWTTHALCTGIDVANLTIDGTLYTAGNNTCTGNHFENVYAIVREASTNANVYSHHAVGYTVGNAGLNAASILMWFDETEQFRIVTGSTERFRVNNTDTFVRSLRFFETFTAAAVPGNFSATHYVPIKDTSGTTYYLPVKSAPW